MSSNYVCLQIIFSSCVNIEALVIFKKTQFALGAKKNERSGNIGNKNMYDISSIKRENQEVSGRFTL